METPSSTDDRSPEVGDVIEFSFLWTHEQAAGRIEGAKDRRCVIIRVLDGPRIAVVPITSSEPEHDNKIALSPGALGLSRPSWIVTSEINVSDWPGYDLRPASKPDGAFWRYGRISDRLRLQLADAISQAVRSGRAKVANR